jgi:hypothetical protein
MATSRHPWPLTLRVTLLVLPRGRDWTGTSIANPQCDVLRPALALRRRRLARLGRFRLFHPIVMTSLAALAVVLHSLGLGLNHHPLGFTERGLLLQEHTVSHNGQVLAFYLINVLVRLPIHLGAVAIRVVIHLDRQL